MATRHAVLACAATTTATFGILAMSSIPVLKFLGLTVAIGSISSFLLAWAGSSLYKQRISPDAN
jgi:predicted exporter